MDRHMPSADWSARRGTHARGIISEPWCRALHTCCKTIAFAGQQTAHSSASSGSCAWFSWWGVVAVAAASTLLLHVLLDRLPDCFTLGESLPAH